MKQRRTQNTGFTVIELVVSIGIIAILVSLLVPTLAGARDASKTLVCATQLRSMSVALRSYAQENDQLPVSSRFIGISIRAGSPPPADRVLLDLPEAIAGYLDADLPTITQDGTVSDTAPWTCPAEARYTEPSPTAPEFIPDGFSYGYGGMVLLPDLASYQIYEVPDIPGLGRITLRYFEEQPTRVILFDEEPFHADDPANTVGPDGRTHARFDGSIQTH